MPSAGESSITQAKIGGNKYLRNGQEKLVGPNGLEPSTSSVSGRRSNQLSYGPATASRFYQGTLGNRSGYLLREPCLRILPIFANGWRVQHPLSFPVDGSISYLQLLIPVVRLMLIKINYKSCSYWKE